MIYPESFEYKVGFDAVRARITELCVSSAGKSRVESIRFTGDYELITKELGKTEEMLRINLLPEHFSFVALPSYAAEIARLKIPGTFLSAQELYEIGRLLLAAQDITRFFKNRTEGEVLEFPLLSGLAAEIVSLPVVARLISRTIDRYGNVLDSASPELAEIRRQISSTSGRINSIMRKVVSRGIAEGYLEADTTPSIRDGRLVLPVQPMNKRKVQGIVHDESASGKTYFIEPAEIVEANNRVRELRIEERREITRILTEVANELRPHADSILYNADIISEFDFIHAKALYAEETGANLPAIKTHPEIEWFHATHPVLLESLNKQEKELVPLDITLNSRNRILVISGPNAGGKSVCLKTVGIVQYMMQCGLLPPLYSNSTMGIFKDIFIDIGDNQSIENELSTYSSHLRNMKQFMTRGCKRSLLLIDEFGSGTEPQIGGALAQAILKEFNSQKMWGIITTHYQNLKHFAEDTPGLINGSMLYDRQRMEPLFKLNIGNPGSSFAIEIARKTGLPKNIIDDASEIVGSDYINLDKYLLDIARDKRYWENKRDDIKKREKNLEDVISRYENEAETLRQKRKEILDDARRQAKEILDGSNATIERTIREIRTAAAEKEATKEARLKLEKEKSQLAESETPDNSEHKLLKRAPRKKKQAVVKQNEIKTEKDLQPGDAVKLDGEGMAGEIISISGDTAVVAFGMLKTNVPLKRLKHTLAKVPSPLKKPTASASASMESSRQRQLNFKPEIDLRGMRADEAVRAVTYFIDDAQQFSIGRVRILHGTGTGALRQVIRQYLATVPGVTSFRDEDVRFGGAGITVVEMK